VAVCSLIVYKEKTDRHATEARDDGFKIDRRASLAMTGFKADRSTLLRVNIFRRA